MDIHLVRVPQDYVDVVKFNVRLKLGESQRNEENVPHFFQSMTMLTAMPGVQVGVQAGPGPAHHPGTALPNELAYSLYNTRQDRDEILQSLCQSKNILRGPTLEHLTADASPPPSITGVGVAEF